MRKKSIITRNKNIFDKLQLLNFTSEVWIKKSSIRPDQITRILKNINGKSSKKILDLEKFNDHLIIRKVNPINFEIYLYDARDKK